MKKYCICQPKRNPSAKHDSGCDYHLEPRETATERGNRLQKELDETKLEASASSRALYLITVKEEKPIAVSVEYDGEKMIVLVMALKNRSDAIVVADGRARHAYGWCQEMRRSHNWGARELGHEVERMIEGANS